MARICLVACAKSKAAIRSRADELYVSTLFSYARNYARAIADRWYILSARHGLLAPDVLIQPYDETLKGAHVEELRSWADRVLRSLLTIVHTGDEIVLLAGSEYRRFLVPELERLGCKIQVPLAGMPIGVQISWLKRHLERMQSPARLLDRFYDQLRRLEVGLGGKRELRSCTGRMSWPRRGVYFFFEPGELRSSDPTVPRVVRVGTHAVGASSGSTLWSRLHTHRGGADGRGYHRGSVFRLHIGAALMRRENKQPLLTTWGQGSTASAEVRVAERELEQRVSRHIGSMSILWLAVEDTPGPRSDRSYIERNTIALLSTAGHQIDPPNKRWLGASSPHEVIRQGGLWNVQWVGGLTDPRALDVIDRYIDATIGKRRPPRRPIAPAGRWGDPQLSLFRK